VGGLYESRAAFWLKLEYETTKCTKVFIVIEPQRCRDAEFYGDQGSGISNLEPYG
jgi:hypothetical protein